MGEEGAMDRWSEGVVLKSIQNWLAGGVFCEKVVFHFNEINQTKNTTNKSGDYKQVGHTPLYFCGLIHESQIHHCCCW